MIAGNRVVVFTAVLLFASACDNNGPPEAELTNTGTEMESVVPVSDDAVDINTASFEELQRIPHVGASMAEKIVEHRERFGRFKRPEELMLITGISDARFRRIRQLIRVE